MPTRGLAREGERWHESPVFGFKSKQSSDELVEADNSGARSFEGLEASAGAQRSGRPALPAVPVDGGHASASASINYIDEATQIQGDVSANSAVTVAGSIHGCLTARGDIEVRESALIEGDVCGPNVRISGQVQGRVSASGKLVITATGKVLGDIAVRSLLIEDGGTLQGQCNMGDLGTAAYDQPGVIAMHQAVG